MTSSVDNLIDQHLVAAELSPFPIRFVVPEADTEMTAWAGMVMPTVAARTIAAGMFGVPISPSVKVSIAEQVRHAAQSGAYGPRRTQMWWSWLHTADIYRWLSSRLFSRLQSRGLSGPEYHSSVVKLFGALLSEDNDA